MVMPQHFLIIGGAGFIGSHLADELLAHGHRVRVLDPLIAQVHGAGCSWPEDLDREVELHRGDVRDPLALERALAGIDGVFHLAAMVGVGQSMYEIERYVGVNELGTAALLQRISERPVGRLVIASSMSIYGEGLYRDRSGQRRTPRPRPLEQLRAHQWDIRDDDGEALEPVATDENKTADLASVYALSKFAQERMALIVGSAYGIESVALRLFNVFGSRQALSNPYTGVLAIFASRLLNGQPPLVFEDGRQRRDFVHVKDVARAFHLAMTMPDVAGMTFNIGSGRCTTVASVAHHLANAVGRPSIGPVVTQRFRAGDIRHCFADISEARARLGYEPRYPLETSLGELVEWLDRQTRAEDHVASATDELMRRGLVA